MATPPQEFRRHYFAENWYRTWHQWKERRALVGFLVLALTFLGYGWIGDNPRVVAAGTLLAITYVAVQFSIASPWSMWDDATRRIAELEERLTPRLRLVFKSDELPYVQELVTTDEDDHEVKHRMIRVGIQNDSDQVIPRSRVVIESFRVLQEDAGGVPALSNQPVLIEHALTVMGLVEKQGFVSVAPGDRPTAFIDVMRQTFSNFYPDVGDWMSPCYASGHHISLEARTILVLELRVEGGGTYSRASFRIGATGDEPRIMMTRRGE